MDLYNDLKTLRKEREEYRKCIRKLWKEGKTFNNDDMQVSKDLNTVHAKILELEMELPNVIKKRTGYSVCGYSERHGYFRNKRFISEDYREAEKEFEVAKTDPDWGIPTLLVRESFFRNEAPGMVDFDKNEIGHLSFSNHQEIIKKHMCGNKQHRWKFLIDINPEGHRYTY